MVFLEFAEQRTPGEARRGVQISQAADCSAPLFCPACSQPLTLSQSQDALPAFIHPDPLCPYLQEFREKPHIRVPLYHCFLDQTFLGNYLENEHLELNWAQQEALVAGTLSLPDFLALQEPRITQRFSRFQQELLQAGRDPNFLTDLKLYEWSLDKFESFRLFLLQAIPSDAGQPPLYYLGSAALSLAKLYARCRRDLPPALNGYKVEILYVRRRLASVEYYALHRLRKYQARQVGLQLSPAWFCFASDPDQAPELLQELQQLLYVRPSFRRHLREGMQRARNSGRLPGRPKEDAAAFLQKKSSQRIIPLLEKGLSLRKIAKRSGHAVNTVRKVKAAWEAMNGESEK